MTETSAPQSLTTGSVGVSQSVERVVVGVDGSEGSLSALRWGLREAQLRDVPVHAVLAWQFHPSWTDPGLGRMFPTNFGSGVGDPSGLPAMEESDVGVSAGIAGSDELASSRRIDAEAAVTNMLEAAIAEVVEGGNDGTVRPGVRITLQVIEGHAAKVLLDVVTDSDLLVVGSRGHGEFAGALLGSISQHVVSHAPCPVVVVPDPGTHRT